MKAAAAALLAVCLTGCVPWTVRPIAGNHSTTPAAMFDPAKFAAESFNTRLRPAIEEGAIDLAAWLKRPPGGPPHVMVTGRVRVLKAVEKPPSSWLEIDAAPYDGRADATIQTGPVMRGTALRDATGLVSFGQFVNQIDYAAAGNALNDCAARLLPSRAELANAAGRELTFAGAFTVRPGALPEIVAVRLAFTGASK